MRRYFKCCKFRTVGALITIIISSVLSVMGAFILSGMVNVATTGNGTALARYILIAAIYLAVLRIVGRLDNYLQNGLIHKITLMLRMDVFSSIVRGKSSDFHKKTVGEYMSIITNDVEMISGAYVNFSLSFTGTVVSVSVVVISMIYMNPFLLLLSALIGVFYLIFTCSISKNLSDYKEQWVKSIEKYTSQIKNLLIGYDVIHDYDLQNKSVEMFEKDSCHVGEQKRALSIKVDNLNTTNYIIGQAIVFLIVYISSYLVATKKMSVGELIALAQLMVSIITPLQEMTSCINEVTSAKNIKKKLLDKINQSNQDLKTRQDVTFADDTRNQISLEDVSFSYDGQHNVLDHVNFNLEQGKKYLILGESGSGKSSLIGLLMNHFQNYKGKIAINGIDYRGIDDENISKMFAVVHQNVVLFDGTLKDNITLFQNKDSKEVNKVIDDVCLDRLTEKKGLQSILSENGATLSGGERQRISIARALLTKRKYLVLDEPTSALDEKTATQILTNILEMKDQTCIAILHHLPDRIKKMFDYVFVLENGKLVLQNE